MVQGEAGYTLGQKTENCEPVKPVMIPGTKVALLESIDCDQ